MWDVGILAYDISMKQNFQLRAVLMWTISDFPGYAMLSRWSTAGRLACPYCMGHSEAFTLSKSGKQSWFDTHHKFLPANHIFQRNRYVFHKNMVVTAMTPPILSGNKILHLTTNLGLKKITEIGASDINDSICKAPGWKKRSIF